MRVTVVAAEHHWGPLAPLLAAYAGRGYAVRRVDSGGAVPGVETLTALAERAGALLVVGPRRRAPRTVLPGPVVRRQDGTPVPAGWLPDTGGEALARFATAAARLYQRESRARPVAILSQWQPRYLLLARRMESLLAQGEQRPFLWSSDLLFREDMARGLRAGLAAAIYVGHGRPVGWVGYRGTRLHHLAAEAGEPLGAVLSLCCDTASRRRNGLSFAEAIPLHGVAAAALGATGSTLHLDNTRWAVGLCRALSEGAATLAELVVRGLPLHERAANQYRILGDPLAPLAAAPEAEAQAQAVPLYP